MGRADMWGVRVSDEEAARRKALAAEFYERTVFPPLYRVSSMNSEAVLHGSFGSSPVKTLCVFTGEGGLSRPRLEVHTFVDGAPADGAGLLWLLNFDEAAPPPPTDAGPVPVTVSGTPLPGRLLAITDEGWMMSVTTQDAALVVIGPGKMPDPLRLEPVDMRALKRSEFRNSGITEG